MEQLRKLLDDFGPYPKGVIAVTETIPGTAFFPGGQGLWMERDGRSEFPFGGVMVLGHNFDSEANYKRSLQRGREDVFTNPTWRNLVVLFREVGVAPKEVFFTNFFMGLIAGNQSLGRFPGFVDPGFVRRCEDLFVQQFDLQRPRIVLVLGIHVPPLLASLSEQLSAWTNVRSFAQLDPDKNIFNNVRFRGSEHAATIVSLTHPSYRHLNVARRRYRSFEGAVAEIELLRDALSSTR